MMSDEEKFRTMDWVIGTATTVALMVSSWAIVGLINVQTDVAVINSTRFTPDDADRQVKPQLDLIILLVEGLKEDINKIETKLEHKP